jgi:small subunit ribosomal protein S19
MADKIFKYKGKTLDELKAMKIEELALLFNSDVRRKIKRGFTEQEKKLLAEVQAHVKNIKTHCRDMIVLPEMVGQQLQIHKGKEFVPVDIVDDMIGMRLGDLAPTRKIGIKHSSAGSKAAADADAGAKKDE